MDAKISQKHDEVNYIRKNYKLKYADNDRNEYIDDKLLV